MLSILPSAVSQLTTLPPPLLYISLSLIGTGGSGRYLVHCHCMVLDIDIRHLTPASSCLLSLETCVFLGHLGQVQER